MILPSWLDKAFAGPVTTAIPYSFPAIDHGFCDGNISTAATTRVAVMGSTYVEQTTNARRSFASSSVNDAAAGTGARTITIEYLDQDGNGPFRETITLNGVTPVNTVATNICYIDEIWVTTVGSGGVSAGNITMYIGIGGAGGTLGVLTAGDNQTYWAHHYVPANRTTYVDSIAVNNDSKTVTSLVSLWSKPLAANSAEIQISDRVTGGGANAGQATRAYTTPIEIVGPARIRLYVVPETNAALITRAAFDFYDL